MLFDTHAHYDSERFDNDRDDILINSFNSGVELILNPGCDIGSSQKSIEISQKHDFVFSAVGIHPHEAVIENKIFDELDKMFSNEKVVAMGEIGLDYHYNFKDRETQKKCFCKQLELAKMRDLPVIIHDRESHQDIIDILKSDFCKGLKGVLHCFSGSKEMAKIMLDLGFYLSFGGVLTFKNAIKSIDIVNYMPLDKLLIETDAPYLAPVPYRGKRNDSMLLKFVAEKISEIRNVEYDEICNITNNNGRELFKIKNR